MSEDCTTEDELVPLMPDLARLTRRLARDPAHAEDLAQEALVRVWARMAEGGTIADLRPYLMEAARNLARRPGRRYLALEEAPEPVSLPEAEGRLALRDVACAMARLPAGEARLLIAVAARGEGYAALAEAEGVTIGAVMSRIARARARLRTDIDGGPSRTAA